MTETVIEKETPDATGTVNATGTGIAKDATLVSHFSLYPLFLPLLTTIPVVITVRGSRRGGGGDHWEPEDRERRNSDVRRHGTSPSKVVSYTSHSLFPSVAGVRAHLALALVLALVHGVVRPHPAVDVRGVPARVVALRAAAHATATASNRKQSHALSVDR